MRVLIAPQEYKGTLSPVQAVEAIAQALSGAFHDWELDLLPMADGGPGTASALLTALGGESRTSSAHDPLMRPVQATWASLASSAAVIEVAEASGLWRLRRDELDPRRATTYGTGELIAAALNAGCRDFLIGLGGSATNDGGSGMAQALGYELLDAQGGPLAPGGAGLAKLDRIETDGVPESLRQSRFIAPTDVTNPLCGPNGASAVFGPQKGADAADIAELDAALARFAEVVARDLGVDVRDMPGAGAAGGCGAGVIAFLGATVQSGAEAVAQATGLEARIQAADLVITGEGRLDGQTEFGKGPQYVAHICRSNRKPVLCVAGSLGPGHERLAPWFDVIESATSIPPETLPSSEVAAQQIGEAAVRGILLLLAQPGRFGSA